MLTRTSVKGTRTRIRGADRRGRRAARRLGERQHELGELQLGNLGAGAAYRRGARAALRCRAARDVRGAGARDRARARDRRSRDAPRRHVSVSASAAHVGRPSRDTPTACRHRERRSRSPRIGASEVREWHRARVLEGPSVIAVVGDVDPDEMATLAARALRRAALARGGAARRARVARRATRDRGVAREGAERARARLSRRRRAPTTRASPPTCSPAWRAGSVDGSSISCATGNRSRTP